MNHSMTHHSAGSIVALVESIAWEIRWNSKTGMVQLRPSCEGLMGLPDYVVPFIRANKAAVRDELIRIDLFC